MELPRQLVVRSVVLRDDHQQTAAVEAMDDSGPLFTADAAQVADVVEQRVHQRAAGMAGRRMHDHSGRLVDDHEIAILVDDPERKVLGLHRRHDRLGATDEPPLTAWFDLASRPATCTWPFSINRWIWDLECVPRTDARKRSRRWPALSSGTVS